jgi:hypothetical protein
VWSARPGASEGWWTRPAPVARNGERHRSAEILVEALVARLAAAEYALTLEAEPDEVTARLDGRLRVAE